MPPPLVRHLLLPWLASVSCIAPAATPRGLTSSVDVSGAGMAAEALPKMLLPPSTAPWLIAYAVIITALCLILFARWWPRHKQQRAAREALIERDRRMRLALWGAGEAFWDYDLTTHTLTATLYPSPDSDETRTLPFEVHPDDIDSAIAQLQQFLAAPDGRDLVLSNYRVRFIGHEWLRASARGRVVRRDAQGKPLLLSGTARDISWQVAAEQAQKVAVEIFQNMKEAVAILDADFNLISFNEAFVSMTGHSHEALRNQPLWHLLQLPTGQDIASLMRQSLDDTGHWDADLWQKHASGHETLCRVRASAIQKDAGTSSPEGAHYVLVLSDIAEQRLTHEELRLLANHDPLTDLPNRTLFKRRLEEALHRTQAPAQLAVLFLDLDRFKDINDSLGHAIGDMVLQETGKRLCQIAPPGALVARSGGDEFAIIIEQIADESRATELARKILADFNIPLQLENGLEFSIAPSIGISLYPEDGHDADTLLRKADTAMYRAKNAGRQMFRRYHPGMDQQVVQRLQVVNLLRGATDRGEISLVYQPRFCLQCQDYCGVEALLRWRHPELGIVPPSEFIPLAEESGLIIELGHWVIEEACKTLAQWQAAGLDGIGMAINVSSMQLLREDFPDLVISHVRRHGIKPELLELEITESVFLDNPRLASDRLLALGGQGIRISIDDFGTGYSSLAYLRSLPINRIKIDRAFIASASHNPREEAIIIAIINMAQAMQVEVVAEGVETREQLQMLQQHGCNEVQGFFLSRPLPADDCFALLQSGHAPLDPRATA